MLSLMLALAAILQPPSIEFPEDVFAPASPAAVEGYLAPPPKKPCDPVADALGPRFV